MASWGTEVSLKFQSRMTTQFYYTTHPLKLCKYFNRKNNPIENLSLDMLIQMQKHKKHEEPQWHDNSKICQSHSNRVNYIKLQTGQKTEE